MDVIDPDRTPPRSDNFYGWAKLAYEGLGFLYASGWGPRKLENVQIRIGAPRELKMETFFPRRYLDKGVAVPLRARRSWRLHQRSTWTQLIVKSIETPNIEDEHGIPHQIFYGDPGNARRFWSIVNARKVIGYAPEDDAEIKYANEILPKVSRRSPARGIDPGQLAIRPSPRREGGAWRTRGAPARRRPRRRHRRFQGRRGSCADRPR